ncbi:MAG: zinc ribbon domain-containing protein [Gemmatimonadota bacterium]|nr:MAG: zinc ribbon domain-containing protein [Gemmatimonadota bacterium]
MSQTASQITCPKCGKSASGKFCTHCGAPLTEGICAGCNSPLSPGASFCHSCGAAAGSAPAKPGGTTFPLPWAVALGAVVVVVIVLAVRFTSPQPVQTNAVPQGPAPSGAPDISTMTPRQQADRLFDMIMSAAEAGDTGRVAFHTDMAIQAYSMLGELDGDARYHVGLIHIVRGETDEALAEAEALQAAVPDHLLAHLLRGEAARVIGDSASLQNIYREFLSDYDREIAIARPEYEMHRNSIESFLADARSTGASGN